MSTDELKAKRIAEIDRIITEIHRMFKKPNYKPQTSSDMKQRADRLMLYANSIRANGGKVKPEYMPNERTDDELV